ncbi:HD domain-containing protein [Geomonas sp.]|uniref:HD domain-containing protein n=1 Tax=Geomonas sp. TaxID=2651584 RepID=UPI002B45C486|nr:HD domain-containing protein [Geomonas sp.]HJV35537.1 HD domain-containing protein [Geomonas sp.]
MADLVLPELAPLHAWFDAYCASFRSDDPELQRNFDLKEIHTRKVCEAARLIAGDEDPRRLMLAETAALCHDLGRFPQFREYRTFKDSDSVNHAQLSAEILTQRPLLDFLAKSERQAVITAVRLHNVFQIRAGLEPQTDDLLRIVRDADKVDIWRVFIEYYNAPQAERASGAGLGFADLPVCSPAVLAALASGELVQLSSLETLNDFKLLQLSWLYDINFRSTLRLIKERGVLEQLAATLPKEGPVLEALSSVFGYLERRLSAV